MDAIKRIKLSNLYLKTASKRLKKAIKTCLLKGMPSPVSKVHSESNNKGQFKNITGEDYIKIRKKPRQSNKHFINSLSIDLPIINEEKLPMLIHKIDPNIIARKGNK